MSQVALWVRIPLKPGVRAEAVDAFQFALDYAMKEDGTLHYVLASEDADPDALFVWELYTGQDAFMAHVGAEWFKEFGGTLGDFVAGAPEMHFLTPLKGKGL